MEDINQITFFISLVCFVTAIVSIFFHDIKWSSDPKQRPGVWDMQGTVKYTKGDNT